MKYLEFICRKRKHKYHEDITWINTDKMPYYNPTMISLYAYSKSLLNPKFNSKVLHMRYWTLEYICEGEYTLIKDNNTFKLSAGDFFILYPGLHYTLVNKGDVPVKTKEIMLNNSPLISILCNRSALNGCDMIRCTNSSAIEAYFDQVGNLVSQQEDKENLERELPNTVFALFTEIITQCQEKIIYNSFDGQLKHLNVFSPDLTLDKMAEHFKVGKRTLNRMFNKYLKCSPFQYLIFARMKYAVQLLSSNTLSIKNVAEECGYKNSSFFIAEFKKYFKKTPLEYRKSLDLSDDLNLKKIDPWNRILKTEANKDNDF